MKTSVSYYDFQRAFERCDRANQFSREGLETLFDYLEAYEDGTGEEIELDVIALCCDYTESTFAQVADDYSISIDYDDGADDEERAELLKSEVLDYLNDHTTIVGEVARRNIVGEVSDDSVIYQRF